MQKLDFTENLKILTTSLNSYEIVDYIDKLPAAGVINTHQLTPIIIESKSNYDKIGFEDKRWEILQALDSDEIYNDKKIAALINSFVSITVQSQSKVQLFLRPELLSLYNFHRSLISTLKLGEEVLLRNNLLDFDDNGTIIFRVLADEELTLTKYSRILNLLKDLIEIIQKIDGEENIEPRLTLLDSGSDTNLGIKTTVETAKSLFQIFKEVWDWVLNRKFYNSKLRNAGLLDNLNVLVAIKNAQDTGAIDENTAKIYKETVIRRTEDLLELNVIPKDLIDTSTRENSRKLLSEYTEIRLLENRDNSEEK